MRLPKLPPLHEDTRRARKNRSLVVAVGSAVLGTTAVALGAGPLALLAVGAGIGVGAAKLKDAARFYERKRRGLDDEAS